MLNLSAFGLVGEFIRFPCPKTVPVHLISFLKAIPDGRFSRGVRYPQWLLLLLAVLGILSGCRGSRDLEAFAKRHRKALNQALGLDFKRWPSDATFLYLFNKVHLQQFRCPGHGLCRALGVALAQKAYDTHESRPLSSPQGAAERSGA